ncbi:cytochrome-c peroxidase [Robertkochia marina]|uniref:Cytochrome-c peroxidase n=1 Tax=Robertkochia marina TaxID=1227945 RepID=A0A4S3M4L7_9FLAO|nr:cytochrome c peroxidase [Robertkochia marina]THD69850.1 cytochrome-c peroxidase [Robertkochia marina]TRZ46805.1 cytochrome-c peroxidase [Robertkochia marina]
MFPITKNIVWLICCSGFLVACSSDDTTIDTPSEDTVLQEQLETLYGSLSELILPESDQYSEIPADPSNLITAEKVLLGKHLFHETALGVLPKKEVGKATYSCASCHHSEAGFQAGVIQGIGEGGIGFGLKGETRHNSVEYQTEELDVQPIRSPSILNVAYQEVMLWNGQFGALGINEGTQASWSAGTPKEKNNLGFSGVETQAIAAIDVHRLDIPMELINNTAYKSLFDQAFPDAPPEERYTKINAGLAIAAYERTVLPTQAPFQKWLKGERRTMSEKELAGASLFYGKANCYQCHSGPGMNGMSFHNLGMSDLSGTGVHGEIDEETKMGRGGFSLNPQDNFMFKTPQLYNLKDVKFLGHGGGFSSVEEVIRYKNKAIAQNAAAQGGQLSPLFIPLNLTEEEITQLVAFVENALYDPNLERYVPEALPSGHCFPNADTQSKIDLGCE